MARGAKTVLEKLGLISKTPCHKDCTIERTVNDKAGSSLSQKLGAITLAVAVAYITAKTAQLVQEEVDRSTPTTTQSGVIKKEIDDQSLIGRVGGLPLQLAYLGVNEKPNDILGAVGSALGYGGGNLAKALGIDPGWERGAFSSQKGILELYGESSAGLGLGVLGDLLFPKPVSAAGKGGGGADGFWGAKGPLSYKEWLPDVKKALDFSKFKFKLPKLEPVTNFFKQIPAKALPDVKKALDFSKFKFKLPSLAPVINFFEQIPAKAWDFLSQLPGIVTTTFWSAVGNARSGAQQIYSGVKSYVSQIPGMVYNEFMSIAQRIMDTLGSLYDAAYQAGQSILSGIRDITGISSPGYIYYMIQGELSNVLGVMDEYRQPFARGASNLGASLVNNMTPLGKPNLPGQYGASAGAGVTIHYHQETIDARNWSKEELMAMLYTIYQGGTGG